MFKFFAAFRKERIILTRDWAGLMILFIMPMAMVIILTLVQELGWNVLSKEPQIKVLFVNEDKDSLGTLVEAGLKKTHIFQLIQSINSTRLTEETARNLISKGTYQIGVYIPKGSTQKINRKVRVMTSRILSGIMMPLRNPFLSITDNDSVNITVFFDPTVRGTFKNAFMSSMKEFSLKIESDMIFSTFNDEIKKLFPQYKTQENDYKETVHFTEIYPSGQKEEAIPSTTQHNVPSWAIFAMFFIVIPLSGSIIKEREEGSVIRLHTLPVSYLTIFMAKIGVYLVVCMIQFLLMILSGIFILPLFDLPALSTGNHYFNIIIMVIVTSLSALGYGILVGTIARTQQQAAAFGSVSVVILTAIGGLWVPVYLMPETMRHIASFSPLNWAHSGFLDIFLRNGTFNDILPNILKLLSFFIITISIAGIYRKMKPPTEA